MLLIQYVNLEPIIKFWFINDPLRADCSSQICTSEGRLKYRKNWNYEKHD